MVTSFCSSPCSVSADGDYLDSDKIQSANKDPLKLQEEELQWKTELEEEEKKLEEALEYQTRFENETKVKHLSMQQYKKCYMTFCLRLKC